MGKAAKAAAKAAAKKKGGSSSGLIGGALVAAVAVAAYYGVAQLQQQQATPPPKAELRQPPKTERRQTAANSATADQAVSSEEAALAAAASGRRIAEDQLNMPNHEKPKRVDNGQPPPEPGCGDDDDNCATWASTGECDANPQFMKATCRWSCGLCRGGKPPKPKGCADQNAMCATWASIGECESNPGFMKQQCPVTCRICQSEDCKDTRPDCAERVRGGAESNYSATGCYTDLALRDACAWTCVACGLKRVPRCARKQPATPAARPGSTNAMFERLAARPGATVWSREPWVVTLDDFLTDAEANEVLRSGGSEGTGWGRSMAGDGVQSARTSSTSWCKHGCLRNPTIVAVQDRVAEATGVPVDNSEFMQVLEYNVGEYYKVHHDQNSPRSSAWGPRMYTFFLYLAQSYTGGQTHFPRLNITIPAKKGSALIWPSILDSDPYERDDRTDHEALPVESGVKYAANYWLHMFPYRTFDGMCDNQAQLENWY